MAQGEGRVAEVVNPQGSHRVVLVCEHASPFIPPAYSRLGVSAEVALSHVAWDPGASEVAEEMSRMLDAPLVRACVSRLVYDCNRPPEAPDCAPARSEVHDIPGNAGLTDAGRMERARAVYFPFRDLLAEILAARTVAPVIVTIHTFTPVYFGKPRAVEIGILHDEDSRLADAMLAVATGHDIRRNEPYGPADGVTHTLKVHGLANGWLNVMIEVRNDLVRTPDAAHAIARDLTVWLQAALAALSVETRREARA